MIFAPFGKKEYTLVSAKGGHGVRFCAIAVTEKEKNMDKLQQELFKLQDLKYRDFYSKLMPGIDKETIIGIRTPVLRKFAERICKNGSSRSFFEGTSTSVL